MKKDEIEIGEIPFVGGLLKGIEKLVDLAERVEQAGGEIKKRGEILGQRGRAKGVYGFSIRTGIGGQPKIQTFGNIKETKKGPRIIKTREPIVDVFDEKNHILIIAELPGITEQEIKTILKQDIFVLEAGQEGEKKYYKEVLLPAKVSAQSEKRTYKNGILEIKFKKV